MLTTTFLISTLLPLLTFAAPLATANDDLSITSNAANMGTGGGIIGFIVLVLDILVWSKYYMP